MIAPMSKVEVVGPRDRLIAVLDTIRATHTLQIDPDIQQRMRECAEARLAPLELDSTALAERAVHEELAARIDRLLALLPPAATATARLNGAAAFGSVTRLIETHLASWRDREAHFRLKKFKQRRDRARD